MEYRKYLDNVDRKKIDEDFNAMKRSTFPCIICKKEFKPTKPYQQCCSKFCIELKESRSKEREQKIYNRPCKYCGKTIRKTGPNKGCMCEDCRKEYSRLSAEKVKASKPIVEKKKRKGLPITELIRRMEYKRVMDDSGWDHFNKGRKYDKI